jgi:hypothetical protein
VLAAIIEVGRILIPRSDRRRLICIIEAKFAALSGNRYSYEAKTGLM